jgi:hypothetical protein
MIKNIAVSTLVLAAALAANAGASALVPASQGMDAVIPAQIPASYGKLPLAFEANQGQTAAEVRYLARGLGYSVFLTPREAVLSVRTGTPAGKGAVAPAQGDAVRIGLAHANAIPQILGEDVLPGTSNYFIGADASRWLHAVPQYAKVGRSGSRLRATMLAGRS